MALEQFFYRRLKAEIAVDDYISAVLERTCSVALLKVLCDVGRLAPSLFVGPLRPLLAAPEIYRWDIHVRAKGRNHLMIGAFLRGEWFMREAHAFHVLEHRNRDLRWVALETLLGQPEMRLFFDNARVDWERRAADEQDAETREMLQQLLVLLDPENFEVKEDDGRILLINPRANELQEARADEQRQSADRVLAVLVTAKCRMLLDQGEGLPPEELEVFWQQLQYVHGLGDDEEEHEEGRSPEQIASVICGGIAVLLRYHEDWLELDETKAQWCVQQLITIVLSPPPRMRFHVPTDASGLSWDCFAAEALSLLWVQDPDEPILRQLVASLVFAHHYRAVEILFSRCSEHREVLGCSFISLRRLLFEWAYVRARIIRAQWGRSFANVSDAALAEQVDQVAGEWASGRIQDFVESRIPAELRLWQEMDVPELFADLDAKLPVWHREEYPLDYELIQAAHMWLPTLDRAYDAAERSDWIMFWQEALAYVLRRTRPRANGRDPDERLVPNPDERWTLHGAATTSLFMEAVEGPEKLWQPTLSLRDRAHYWVEEFLQALHRSALRPDSTPSGYVPVLRDIFEFVSATTTQQHDPDLVWDRLGDHWIAILGMDMYTRDSWEQRHEPLVTMMADLFQQWASIGLTHSRWATALARFLERPAATSILLEGLVWLERAAATTEGKLLNDTAVQAAVGSLLNACWTSQHERLHANSTALTAFKGLLHMLAARQHPLALDLQGRIGGL